MGNWRYSSILDSGTTWRWAISSAPYNSLDDDKTHLAISGIKHPILGCEDVWGIEGIALFLTLALHGGERSAQHRIVGWMTTKLFWPYRASNIQSSAVKPVALSLYRAIQALCPVPSQSGSFVRSSRCPPPVLLLLLLQRPSHSKGFGCNLAVGAYSGLESRFFL
jgi:hypothetical protein